MENRTFNVSMPKKLVEEIDRQAKAKYSSRSDYIRQAVSAQLSRDNLAVSNPEAYKIAQNLLRKYESDFKNLAKR